MLFWVVTQGIRELPTTQLPKGMLGMYVSANNRYVKIHIFLCSYVYISLLSIFIFFVFFPPKFCDHTVVVRVKLKLQPGVLRKSGLSQTI